MAIAAQRFTNLTEDFNLAVADFNAVAAEEILNTPVKVFNDLMNDAKDLVAQIKGADQNILGQVNDALRDATRVTKDLFGTFTDLAKLPERMVGDLIDDIFSDATVSVKNLLKNTTKICRNKALGKGFGMGKKFKKPKCSGMTFGDPKCSPKNAANLINSATMSSLNEAKALLNNLLKQIVSLGNLGFGANLCGVFAAITQGLTSPFMIGGIAGLLLNQQGLEGNLMAVFDISKNLSGISVMNDFPDTLKNIAENAVVPFGNFQNDMVDMSARFTGALEGIDETWNMSNWDSGMYSIADLGEPNDQIADMFGSARMDRSLSDDELDELLGDDSDAVLSTYSEATSDAEHAKFLDGFNNKWGSSDFWSK